MRQTENYKWDLQEGTDEIDIEGLNEIFEAADAELAGKADAQTVQENASRAAWSGVPESGLDVHPGIYNIKSSKEWPAGLTLPDELSHLYEGWADTEEELTLISDGCNYFLIYTKYINGGPYRVQVKKFWFRNTGDALYGWVQIFDTEA